MKQQEAKQELQKKTLHSALFIVSAVLISVGIYLGFTSSEKEASSKEEVVKLEEFKTYKDQQMEIIDTTSLQDKELEKWFLEKRQTKGVYLLPKGKETYILASMGEVEKENTFLILYGVKERGSEVIVGYDTLIDENIKNLPFEDNIRATLIKVKGDYKKGKLVKIEELEKLNEQPSLKNEPILLKENASEKKSSSNEKK